METDRVKHLKDAHKHTFNRTNLEWKHLQPYAALYDFQSFNRTNLEWKHRRQKFQYQPQRRLLIAPIWEWKQQYHSIGQVLLLSFNRTNLEWKQEGKIPMGSRNKLLIAPIWNGNIDNLLVRPSLH